MKFKLKAIMEVTPHEDLEDYFYVTPTGSDLLLRRALITLKELKANNLTPMDNKGVDLIDPDRVKRLSEI